MAISRRLRFEILRRDNHTCRYCGRRAPDVALTVDHVKPVALGGTDEPENLVAACTECNSGKASVPADAAMVANVADDALRWARAIETAAWGRAFERQQQVELIASFDSAWTTWGIGQGDERETLPRPDDWEDTIRRFHSLGLDGAALSHFVQVSMKKPNLVHYKVWTYFCGCCWREIDRLQADARQLVEFGDQWRKDVEGDGT